MQKIIAPTLCPSCGHSLSWSQNLLFCYNSECEDKASKVVEHFAKTLKIKGLGPSTIKKLNITSIMQIYELSLEEIAESLNSEKIAVKLFKEISNSRKASLSEVLPAFSIPLIGRTVSLKVCCSIKSIYDLDESVCKAAGLGPIQTDNLIRWYKQKFLGEYRRLPFSFLVDNTPVLKSKKGVVCITGKLKSFSTKAEAEAALVNEGYIVKSSVTKDVTILINESGLESSKTKKARERGVSIETNFNNIIGK